MATDSGKTASEKESESVLWFCNLEAAVKGDKQHAAKQGDFKKDMTDLQRDTIDAIREKELKGYLSNNDVGRRAGSDSSQKKN